jgi:putative PIN family toxin of toxin-antitoxin system
MIRVVLDTNIIVSAHLQEQGLPARVLRLAFSKAIELCVSAPILTEYELLLRRPRFAFDPKRVDQSLARINADAMLVKPTQTLSISPDEPDNRFLECAEAAGASYLVTGNKRHFPERWKGTAVVNAREFLELIGPGLKP